MAAKKSTTTTKKPKLDEEKKNINLDDVLVKDESAEEFNITNTTSGKISIDDNALINVKSNVYGQLIYVDKKTRDTTVWPICGTVQAMTFGELRSMKASQPAFFRNQWIVIVGFADGDYEEYTVADIYKALHITNYYKSYIDPSNYEEVCTWTVGEINEKVALMTEDAKTNMVVALNTYIEKGLLDSLKAIKAFEKALGCELRMPE